MEPPGTTINKNPGIRIFDDFLSIAECENLITAAKPRVIPIRQCWDNYKRCCVAYFPDYDTQTFCLPALGTPERLQVARYSVGQSYPPHMDENTATPRDSWRKTTAVIYLNTPEEGGATHFPELDVRVAAIQGRLLVFNTVEEGEINPLSLHASEEVLAGEKWTATVWFT